MQSYSRCLTTTRSQSACAFSLVRDGFPTDRVELTASCEPGRAGLGPADSGTTQVLRVYGWLKDGVFIRMLPRGRGGARAIRSAVFE